MKKLIYLLPMLVLMMACSHKYIYTDTSAVVGYSKTSAKVSNTNESDSEPVFLPLTPKNFMPKATAFRMTGDYSDNVAITLDSNGNLTYFPAPSDITADSRPIKLVDGWWLNRQGLGQNSVFTTYTFAEYAELPEVPSPEQLKKAIIPGARVSQIYELPYNIGEAQYHISEINSLLKNL